MILSTRKTVEYIQKEVSFKYVDNEPFNYINFLKYIYHINWSGSNLRNSTMQILE